jgi:hypothetical protein
VQRTAGTVRTLRYSRDGRWLAADGSSIQIWDARKGELARGLGAGAPQAAGVVFGRAAAAKSKRPLSGPMPRRA